MRKLPSFGASAALVMFAVTSLFVSPPAAHAAAPMAKTSAPGYYRLMVGEFEVTALSDGTVALPVNQLLTNTTPQKVDKSLARNYLKSPLETSVNAYLVNTGSKLVLIDAGAGKLFGPTLGNLVANVKAAGYQPEQIDAILITHMHPDHVGGMAADGKAVFPNAVVRADKHDAEYWLSEANMNKAPADAKGFFQGAMASLDPYVKAGKLQTFDGETELMPGIRAVPSHGHTAGHTLFVIESKGEKLVFWGDLMHVAAVQFDDPAVTIQFDTDSKAAAAERKKAYASAAREGYLVAGAHLSFPGIGRLRAEGKGYRWIPVNYVPVR